MLKSKVFRSAVEGQDKQRAKALEAEIQKWLTKNPGIKIVSTDVAMNPNYVNGIFLYIILYEGEDTTTEEPTEDTQDS